MDILYNNVDSYSRMIDEDTIILIPVGCIENHGHLPLGTDSLIADRLATDIMKENLNTIKTPVIHYGCNSLPDSGGGFYMTGSLQMNNVKFVEYLEKVVERYVKEGFVNFMFLNCHFENTPCILDTITRLYENHSNEKLKLVNVCYWDLNSKETLDKIFPDGFDAKIEHAGVSETSIIMYLYPALDIRTDKVKVKESNQYKYNFFDFEKIKNNKCRHSVLATPKGSSAEKGKLMWEEYIVEINKIIKKHFS